MSSVIILDSVLHKTVISATLCWRGICCHRVSVWSSVCTSVTAHQLESFLRKLLDPVYRKQRHAIAARESSLTQSKVSAKFQRCHSQLRGRQMEVE